MSIELIIDNRENHLIDALKKVTIDFRVSQLDIGDILFKKDDETILIIERKTVHDLKASICDGRNREQKARLLGSGIPNNRIMYLIEGDLTTDKVSGIPTTTLLGSIINTQLRDDIKVYKTINLSETIIYILKLMEKLQKDGSEYFKEGLQTVQYSNTLKKSKKANMTPNIWFTHQLSQIPQVSDNISEVIISNYPNLCALMKVYEITPEHLREKLLSDLVYMLSTGKSRRIGDKISSRIYKFMYGIIDD
jgi:ERCC4-type nuclease